MKVYIRISKLNILEFDTWSKHSLCTLLIYAQTDYFPSFWISLQKCDSDQWKFSYKMARKFPGFWLAVPSSAHATLIGWILDTISCIKTNILRLLKSEDQALIIHNSGFSHNLKKNSWRNKVLSFRKYLKRFSCFQLWWISKKSIFLMVKFLKFDVLCSDWFSCFDVYWILLSVDFWKLIILL